MGLDMEIDKLIACYFLIKKQFFSLAIYSLQLSQHDIWSADDLGITLLKNSTTNERGWVELLWESQIWVKNLCANTSKETFVILEIHFHP